MEFNIQKYLTENKLTLQSYMREQDDILEPQLGNDDIQDINIEDDTEELEDDWNKPEPDDSEDYEQEPETPEEPVEKTPEISTDEKMLLDKLKNYLSDLIKQYKQGDLMINAYKEKVYHDAEYGNIIKKIRSLEKKFYPQVSVGGEEDNETM